MGGQDNFICGFNGGPGFFYGSCNSAIIGGCRNEIRYDSSYSSVIGGCCNRVCNYSDKSGIFAGGWNKIYNSDKSTVVGGNNNHVCNSDRSGIMAGRANCICNDSYYSAIIAGCGNEISNFSCLSNVIGGFSNEIYQSSCNSTIIGGGDNGICCNSCNSSIIGGFNNYICCSSNSVIIGGMTSSLNGRDNTIMLNGTTWLKQTVEKSEEITATSSVTANFLYGNIKYLSSLSNDFQVDFINFPDPTYSNSVINYTLILNQGATSSMINLLTVNGVTASIKWYNGTQSGTPNQVDKIGLMFVYNNTGTLSQVLGQVETFI